MINFIKKWFKKEEKLEYPRDFAVITLIPTAKKSMINDEFNKKIFRYKNGKLFKIYDFTEDNVKNLKEISEISIMEEKFKEGYDFAQGVEYGQITN